MKTVTVPVSPLSLRIIQAEYGHAQPLRPPTNSELMKQLHHRPTADAYKQRQQHSLTHSLTFSVHDKLAEQIRRHAGSVGYYLFDIHKRRVFREVYIRKRAKALGKGGALGCIQEILDRYFVEEDDYATGTAERLWKRWQEEEENRVLNVASNVPQARPLLYIHQLSQSQAMSVVERLKKLIDDKVVDFDNRSRPSILPFVMYSYTDMSTIEVGKQINSYQTHVSRSARRMRSLIEQDTDFAMVLAYCLHTTKARPVPNLAS